MIRAINSRYPGLNLAAAGLSRAQKKFVLGVPDKGLS